MSKKIDWQERIKTETLIKKLKIHKGECEKILKACNWLIKKRGERKGERKETIFEKMMVKNFLKLMKDIKKGYQSKWDRYKQNK